jgi:hypothetical protein
LGKVLETGRTAGKSPEAQLGKVLEAVEPEKVFTPSPPPHPQKKFGNSACLPHNREKTMT